MATPILSKSKLLSGIQCAKKLWREVHQGAGVNIDPLAQARIDAGIEIGRMARDQYPEGELIEDRDPARAIKATRNALNSEVPVVFEGAFEYEGLYVRTDILERSGSSWRLSEVKATKNIDEAHTIDAAIQYYTVTGSGVVVSKVFIEHLNPACRYPDLSNLFIRTDITEDVIDLQDQVRAHLHQIQDHINSAEPTIMIGQHCEQPRECQFKTDCWQHVPENPVFEVPGLYWTKKEELIQRGILAISEIPDDFKISEAQRSYVEKMKRGEPEIEVKAIGAKLAKLEYPLAFLDFETDMPTIPRFEGCAPLEAFPYQYSLHILDQDGNLTHHEYLHPDLTDPRCMIAERLVRDLEGCKTVVAFNASVEKNVIKRLAEQFPDLRDQLSPYVDRFFDQLPIFRQDYFHPAFKGSRSVKSVLPVINPEMSYSNLDTVADGIAAGIAWNQMIRDTNADSIEGARTRLLAYCKRDTEGMVEIHRHLLKLCVAT